jgi:hypothetical protein
MDPHSTRRELSSRLSGMQLPENGKRTPSCRGCRLFVAAAAWPWLLRPWCPAGAWQANNCPARACCVLRCGWDASPITSSSSCGGYFSRCLFRKVHTYATATEPKNSSKKRKVHVPLLRGPLMKGTRHHAFAFFRMQGSLQLQLRKKLILKPKTVYKGDCHNPPHLLVLL